MPERTNDNGGGMGGDRSAMPRIIEIVLFLAPFLGFAVWRLWFPSPVPPLWMMYGLGAFVGLMLLALGWMWHLETLDAHQPYVPEVLRNGIAVPAGPR